MGNWNSFTKRILINASVDSLYRSRVTTSEIETWFLEQADYQAGDSGRGPDELVQKGDLFSWKWHNRDFTEKGEVLEANSRDTISFTFGAGGNVSVTLKPADADGLTEVILKQYDIPTDDKSKMDIYVGCSTGRTFWLTNLKAYLEHGITLHAKGLTQKETNNLVNS